MSFGLPDILAFFNGTGTDAKGRTYLDYMAFSKEKWEECHDHIQWAFPTKTKSDFNPNAPLIPDDVTVIIDDGATDGIIHLMYRYLASLEIYNHPTDGWYIDVAAYRQRGLFWIRPGDHNMRRITRLFECLGLFGMPDVQREVYEFFLYNLAFNYPYAFDAKTIVFWTATCENKRSLLG